MRTKMLAAAIAAGLTATSLGAWAQSSPAGSDAGELAQLQAQLAALQAKVNDPDVYLDFWSSLVLLLLMFNRGRLFPHRHLSAAY